MKLRILSDLHLEFGHLALPVMDDESSQILILAGDVGLADKPWTYIAFLKEMSERFQDVIYIMGNHEFYGTSILRAVDKIKSNIRLEFDAPNVHVLDNEILRIYDVSFICSTLWASYHNLDSLCVYYAELFMSDHKKIRTGTKNAPYLRKFMAHDAAYLFAKNKDFLFFNIVAEKQKGQKVVGVTHHAPSTMSIADVYKTGTEVYLNGAYASSLEEDIFNSKPDLMIHGHTHHSFDYWLKDEIFPDGAKIRILCNPRGYIGVEPNPNFNPTLVVDI